MSFVDILNESAVTYVRDLAAYGWAGPSGPGWEAISPTGEIRAFDDEVRAQAWRLDEVRMIARL